ncbi:hypothetical protein EDEG_03063 [Edhazardia aedis USNM 41457]|uniref:Uncharacterized protein n=1 Tax=Edhazardia aedis (strain USNM 41457) TaxID=1003232 RepID=J9D4P9_EDHAE|nr:hypothetical protein EDEG_03063 [Edhazardia aedis USNM 41457]|eukprot:EJW02524.1 hypothetical protein EDEG_03063 [Edhazardia aedis USNM 41457]
METKYQEICRYIGLLDNCLVEDFTSFEKIINLNDTFSIDDIRLFYRNHVEKYRNKNLSILKPHLHSKSKNIEENQYKKTKYIENNINLNQKPNLENNTNLAPNFNEDGTNVIDVLTEIEESNQINKENTEKEKNNFKIF